MRLHLLPAAALLCCLACPAPAAALAPQEGDPAIQTPETNATLREMAEHPEEKPTPAAKPAPPPAAQKPTAPKGSTSPAAKPQYGDIIIYPKSK